MLRENEDLHPLADRDTESSPKRVLNKIGFILFMFLTWSPILLFAVMPRDIWTFFYALVFPFFVLLQPYYFMSLDFTAFGIIFHPIYYFAAIYLIYQKNRGRTKTWHYLLLLGISFVNVLYFIDLFFTGVTGH